MSSKNLGRLGLSSFLVGAVFAVLAWTSSTRTEGLPFAQAGLPFAALSVVIWIVVRRQNRRLTSANTN